MAWHVQIHSLCACLSKTLRDVMSTHMLWSIYFACFQSQLKYGNFLWGSDVETMEVYQLQKKITPVITGVHKCESCRHILGNLES
jgi:hypothetical protein